MAPVEALMDKPAGNAVNVPPEVPVKLTDCAAVSDLQNGLPKYAIVAEGDALKVTATVAVTFGHGEVPVTV